MKHCMDSITGFLFGCVVGLGIGTVAHAEELTTSTSGFATYTALSEKSFHHNAGVAAINGSAHYGSFAIKGQLSNNEYQPIRRLALEYSAGIPGDNLTVQLGRIPRLNTMFSDVYGNPDEWDLALLPLSTYNRRKVHSLAFQALDGVKVFWDHNQQWGGIRTTVNYGRGIQEYACEWQQEATRRPCMPSWEFVPRNDNYDVAFEARIGSFWTLLASYNKLTLSNSMIKRDRASITYTTLIDQLDYRFGRLGLRYNAEWGYLQTEHGESRLFFTDKRPAIGRTLQSTAWDDYYLGGYYVTDDLTAFAGHSRGHERGSAFTSTDTFLGAILRNDRWAYTLERHWGDGSWQRHGSNDFDWATWVASATYSW